MHAMPIGLTATSGRAVRGAREAEGISQSELARRAGVSPSVINRIESGAVKAPDPKTTDRIAVALGRSDRILYWLAGNEMTWWAVDDLALPELQAARDDMARAYDEGEADGTVDDVGVWDAWLEPCVPRTRRRALRGRSRARNRAGRASITRRANCSTRSPCHFGL